MKTEINTNNKSLGFASILTLIFITLKLTGFIAWSWWWVLSPIWIPFAIALIFIIVVAVYTKLKGR